MIVVPFEPHHLTMLRAQEAQRLELADTEALAAPAGSAWTAIVGDEVICCAGMVEVWRGRAYAWAVLSQTAGRHLVALTRDIRFRLARSRFARVEMAVDAGFEAGARWAELLGFTLETPEPMRSYLPNGHAAYLYARTN